MAAAASWARARFSSAGGPARRLADADTGNGCYAVVQYVVADQRPLSRPALETGLDRDSYVQSACDGGCDLFVARGWAAAAAGRLRHAEEFFDAAARFGEEIGDLIGAATALHRRVRLVRLATLQCGTMNAVSTAKVSHRGQTSLPASLRHRWGIEDGGEVAFVDLGDAALILPGGIAAAKAELRRVLFDDGGYEAAVAAIDDPDLAFQ